MLPDIKTFSDTLGIKLTLDVSITVKIHGLVHGTVEFNGTRCNPGVNKFTVGLLDKLKLISTIDKFNEGTSAIEITDFTVNGYNVVPKYQHRSSSGNGYHDFIGKWELVISKPFYPWYHHVSGQGWIA